MLNLKKLNLLYALAFAMLVAACKDKEVEPDVLTAADTTSVSDRQAINAWLYEVMDDAYFWYKELPAQSSLDASASPFDYFEKLVYQR